MKKLLPFFLIVLIVGCTQRTSQTNEDDQKSETTSTTEVVPEEVIEKEKSTSKTGLFDYDESKLVFTPTQVLPIDESKQNATLQQTLDELLIVIRDKDVEGLKRFIDKDIKVSFGTDNGFQDFITFWNLDLDKETSLLWDVLENTIRLGGTFDDENKNAYYTPYVFTNFPQEFDVFEFGLIVGEKVNIRAEPNLKSKVVRQLSHEVVRLIAYDKPYKGRTLTIGNETYDWLKIEMADGETGYVWGKFFRSGIDYRAGFAKVRDEGWKMTFFVAGD